ncbi:uncharacterized protein LOC143869894 [Tasmannia lanceolata]|uniref:uncharacterized protein LOC143869894 n=1 Tax=Tasmannia lanceolata TaxID=3420 RepID=UPI004064B916
MDAITPPIDNPQPSNVASPTSENLSSPNHSVVPVEGLIDPTSPFYIHHSDNPGFVLVSQVLTGDNYATWSRAIRAMAMALHAKNKWGSVDGSLHTLQETSPDYTNWVNCNFLVLSWLLNSISIDLADSVIFVVTAPKVWMDLKDRFTPSYAPHIFQMRRAICPQVQGIQYVSSYFSKLKRYWDELSSLVPLLTCFCGAMKLFNHLQQNECVLQFLMGLHDSYGHIWGQILVLIFKRLTFLFYMRKNKEKPVSIFLPDDVEI